MQCRFYVYAYFAPTSDVPFYIGKGTGGRYLEHWKKIKAGRKLSNPFLTGTLRKLLAENTEPKILQLAHFYNEVDAYETEAMLISQHGRKIDGSGILDNIDPGFWNRIGFKGKKHSQETISKMTGRRLTEETRRRMSGPKSEKHHEKLKENGNNRLVEWKLLSPSGETVVVQNLNAFCKSRHLNPTPIYRSLEKRRPVSRGSSSGWQALSRKDIK